MEGKGRDRFWNWGSWGNKNHEYRLGWAPQQDSRWSKILCVCVGGGEKIRGGGEEKKIKDIKLTINFILFAFESPVYEKLTDER